MSDVVLPFVSCANGSMPCKIVIRVVVVVDVANHAILDVDSILLLDDDVLANFHLVDVVAVAHLLDVEFRLFSANMMFCLVLSTDVLVDVLSNAHGDADVPFSLLMLILMFSLSILLCRMLSLMFWDCWICNFPVVLADVVRRCSFAALRALF